MRIGRRRALRAAAALFGGGALGAAYWAGSWGWLSWFALASFWGVIEGLPPLTAALWGWAFGAAGWAVGIYWFPATVVKFVPGSLAAAGVVYLALLAFISSVFAAAAFGARAASSALRRWARWSPTAAFLAGSVPAFVAAEGLWPRLFPFSLSQVQAWHLPLLQVCDLGGGAVLSVLVTFFSASLHLVVRVEAGRRPRRSGARRAAWTALAASCLLAVGAEAYGLMRVRAVDAMVSQRRAAGRSLRVAVAQAGLPSVGRARPESLRAQAAAMNGLTARAAAAGASLVVWPENVYWRPVYFRRTDRAFERPEDADGAPMALRVAEDVPAGVEALLGTEARVVSRSAAGARLRARHYIGYLKRADGTFGGASAKRFPTPFGEFIPGGRWFPWLYSLTPELVRIRSGPQRPLLLADGTRLGVFICYDATKPRAAGDLTLRGAQVLAELTSNAAWFDEVQMPRQILRATRTRAVETRRFILRAVSTGVSAVIDPAGRVVGEIPFGGSGLIEAEAAVLDEVTPAARLGAAPYKAAAALTCLLMLWALRRSGRGPLSGLFGLAGVEVPPPSADPGMLCRVAAPNEPRPVESVTALRAAPDGTYLAVGAERGFIGAALAPRAQGLALVDLDAGVCRFNEVNAALLAACAGREDYLRLRLEARAEDWLKAARDPVLSERQRGLLGDAEVRAWWTATMRFRPRLGLAELVRCRSFAAFHRPPRAGGGFGGGHYLYDEESFARLRSWARSGRISVHRLDISDEPLWSGLLAALNAARAAASVLDLSNALEAEYMGPASAARVLEAARTWADPRAVVLTTRVAPLHRSLAGLFLGQGPLSWSYRARRLDGSALLDGGSPRG